MAKSETHNTDCMAYMATLPDKAFDIAIVDPPYGLNVHDMPLLKGIGFAEHHAAKINEERKKNRFHGKGKMAGLAMTTMNTEWDSKRPSVEYFNELFRISKNQIIWGGNYFDLPPTRCVIAWDKEQHFPSFSAWEMAWTSYNMPAKLFRYSNSATAPIIEKKIHPTQKPVALYKWLLKTFANPGETIIDTHLGSGSSRIACYEMGFDFVGCEIDAEFFEAQEKRFEEYTAQFSLFRTEQGNFLNE